MAQPAGRPARTAVSQPGTTTTGRTGVQPAQQAGQVVGRETNSVGRPARQQPVAAPAPSEVRSVPNTNAVRPENYQFQEQPRQAVESAPQPIRSREVAAPANQSIQMQPERQISQPAPNPVTAPVQPELGRPSRRNRSSEIYSVPSQPSQPARESRSSGYSQPVYRNSSPASSGGGNNSGGSGRPAGRPRR